MFVQYRQFVFSFFLCLLMAPIGCGRGGSLPVATLTPSTSRLNVNQSMQMHLAFKDMEPDARDLASSAIWSVSGHTGSVHNGIVTCQQVGTFDVYAALGPAVAGAKITCIPLRVITAIRFAGVPNFVRSEDPPVIRVLADYSDGTIEDVTSAATWTSETPTAYIEAPGHVFCNTAGDATISAQLGSQVTHATFNCILKRIAPPAGFTESEQEFYGPFPSWINVKTIFGVKGDGITDDTEAIQRALDSLVSKPATLWFPHGKYVITQSLHLQSTGTFSIVGEDPSNTSILWKGPTGGTMMNIEGCNWFRVGRLSWDGLGVAAVAIDISSTLKNGERYPTFDAIHDQKISNVGIGLKIEFAGETTVQRVHFDRNTKAGISLENWNALNFNVIDSLFTDCNFGVTNWYGEGAFNVSNSVFVRSQTADMAMGNTGPFSERQNISIDSKAFFVAAPIGAAANIILQANTIIHPKTNPIQIGTPGPIMLVDNEFIRMDPSFHIVIGDGYHPLGVFSLGNSFTVNAPFGGHLGNVTSIDEAPSASDSSVTPNIPGEVYIPGHSSLPIYEISNGSTSGAIQKVIDAAVMNQGGAVVHLPLGNFVIDQTLHIPDAAKLVIVGDGPVSALVGGQSLNGPIMSVEGTNVALENVRFTSSPSNIGIELLVDDVPSTVVQCDQCKTAAAVVGVESDGIDEASIEIRIGALNAVNLGASIQGGPQRVAQYQTLGRVDAFMTSSDAYEVDNNGHFLIEDGWHDGGQGPVQFNLDGSGRITHQGGTIYTYATGMMANQFSGEISILGVATDSVLTIDKSANTRTFVADSIQISGKDMVDEQDGLGIVSGVANYAVVNNGSPTLRPDVAPTPSWIEHMFAQARIEYPIPNVAPLNSETRIMMSRLELDRLKTGIRILPKQDSPLTSVYAIRPPSTNSQIGSTSNQTCSSAGVAMTGEWSLQAGTDGFYGLKSEGSFLANMMTTATGVESVGLTDTMSDARQRWSVRPRGNGLFEIVNRASGYFLTRGVDGCIALYPQSIPSEQEWAVNEVVAQ